MASPGFKDHFSGNSADYASYRPGYPSGLFAWLAAQVPARDLAWDCATGSGQAALGLAAHFHQVVATDASADQIAQARPHPQVRYRVAPAESSSLPAGSVDLITVAQAAHWFDLPAFHQEVRRVLKPEGALALWCYERLQIEPVLDALIEDFYARLLGPYWPPERRHVETGYQGLAFPFREAAAPDFAMEAAWALDPLMGYFATWSAVKAYRRATGNDPLPALRARLAQAWEASGVSLATPKTIKWPLSVRFGRL
ncbi:MAG: class I SAM-dependent methyltransferase [Pseudomonadota bacterium]